MFTQILEGNSQRQKCLYYTVIALGSLLSLLVLVSSFAIGKSAGFWGQSYPDRTIGIVGEGEIQAVPDIAVFTFQIQEEAESVDIAQKTVSEKIDAILVILDDAGVDEKDIKTTNYAANPQYDWLPSKDCEREYCGNVQTLRNYQVSQTTEVKVRESAGAGEIVGKIGAQNVTYISNLNFTIDDQDILEDQAIELAIEDARTKAEKRAKLMGVRLGDIIDFYDTGNGGYPEPQFYDQAFESKAMMVEAPIEPSFSAGESTIRKSIEVIFEVK